MSSARYRTWEDLHMLRKYWQGKILIKGIQSVEDAKKAVEMKGVIDGIIVSNHGGRQVDGAIASLDALENIMSDGAVGNSHLTVLFDSGIRTGSDILKALALGAKGVLIGRYNQMFLISPSFEPKTNSFNRPMMWGLAMGGEPGVEHVFKCLRADLEINMALAGIKNIDGITKDILAPNLPAKL